MYSQKVAVTIPVTSKQQFAEDSKRAISQGATFIEARVDFYKGEISDLVGTMRKISSKLIVTLRPRSQNGKFEGGTDERVEALMMVERKVEPFRIDIEHDIMDHFKGNLFRRLVSWHDFASTPSMKRMIGLFMEMREHGDIVKIVPTPKNVEEAKRIIKLYQHLEGGNLIAFGMGKYGRSSRVECVSHENGAPFTYASLSGAIAPGQYTLG
ncbi:MAG: type I 3-dehydroquinate dehydratase, partial [Candidatus Micrarchaeota archaeon]|nr:type I 3-dehydroquinate dehydratase [Candidatus Micrarchaeota archaeon]